MSDVSGGRQANSLNTGTAKRFRFASLSGEDSIFLHSVRERKGIPANLFDEPDAHAKENGSALHSMLNGRSLAFS